MAITPGEEILADDILSRFRVGTGFEDTDSATFTTVALEIATVTAALVAGRTYRVKLVTHIGIAAVTAGDAVSLSIKEDSASGTDIQGAANVPIPTATGAGHYVQLETDYTAVATGNKTFSATAVRGGGTGTLRREAAGIRPTIFTVDYAYG